MKYLKLVIVAFLFFSCQTEEDIIQKEEAFNQTIVQVTKHKGKSFQLPTTKFAKSTPGGGVLMQAFYWDVPAGGAWWNTVKSKIDAWSNVGINAIWLPPATKAQNGAFSMGYDPYDYFDFGEFNQNGSIETRFGSKTELLSLINKAHSKNIQVFADIVLNHNSGGQLEYNNYTNSNTWTDFTNVASGKFLRTKEDFHPNNIHANDWGSFGGFPDLCHDVQNVKDWLWLRTDGVGKYYKNVIGFDGWRFDYVKGFSPSVIHNWNANIGGFSVGEYWDSNVDTLNWWANSANSNVFDFACYYKMNDAFDGNNLNILNEDMMWKRNPFKAVTFVTNHDTDIIWKKMLAYAYILTHEGYPTIFYKDYEVWLNKGRLNNLIWIHNNKATGTTSILYTDNDEYIARRNGYNGNPGLVVYLNNSNSWKERWIPTNWYNTQIKDFTGNSNWYPVTQSGGWVKIQSPPNSYSIWSVNM